MNKHRVRQSEFGFTNWGGKRKGAGRKPKGEKAGVPHARREKLAERYPVHVTLRIAAGLPSLRARRACATLRRCLAAGAERLGFRLTQFAVQSNHVHLVCEARNETALSRGVQGLCVRIARGLNRAWRRRGKVFGDRFHARILRTPREVRNALRYVLLNSHKHGETWVDGRDPYSSGGAFDGWKDLEKSADSSLGWLAEARSWLLRVGWRRHGLLRALPVG
jgi:REP element-mobilizing transposase RayT